MKIAVISTSRIPSNTANSIQVMKVCQALQQQGQVVKLWSPFFGHADWDKLAHQYGLNTRFEIEWIRFFAPFKQYDFCWKAMGKANLWNADVIYTWALQAGVMSTARGKFTVMEFHDYPMGLMGPFLFQTFIKSKAKKVILTTTRSLAEGLQSRYGINLPDQILQIAPNGTEPEKYQSLPDSKKARKELELQEKFTLVYSGHFYPGRGMDLMLALVQALPQFQFLWVGGQEKDIKPWKEKLQQLGVYNTIITGFIPNARLPLYQAAGDILLMPYARKIAGSSGGNIVKVINPMKMFDYLAAKRAILASDIPVFHEVLNEQNCVFCRPEDEQDWIDAILNLHNQPAKRKSLAANASRDAARYSWSYRAKTTLGKIQALMGGHEKQGE